MAFDLLLSFVLHLFPCAARRRLLLQFFEWLQNPDCVWMVLLAKVRTLSFTQILQAHIVGSVVAWYNSLQGGMPTHMCRHLQAHLPQYPNTSVAVLTFFTCMQECTRS
jgi:hypothetical protein